MIEPILCPMCLHQQTLNSRLAGREAVYDDSPLMFWHMSTRGIRAQVCTDHDRGWWKCQECHLQLSAHAAGVLLDATLMHAFPYCDSISDGLHADTRRAWLMRSIPPKPKPHGGRMVGDDLCPPPIRGSESSLSEFGPNDMPLG
jgi:hypothetical protein